MSIMEIKKNVIACGTTNPLGDSIMVITPRCLPVTGDSLHGYALFIPSYTCAGKQICLWAFPEGIVEAG